MTLDTICAQPIHAPIVTLLDGITFTEAFGRLFHDYCDDLRTGLDAWLARRNRLPVGDAELNYASAPRPRP